MPCIRAFCCACTEPRMRAGFFLGDGAGVGKGRTIAACIKEHFAAGHGTRALWVSVSKDLNFDAQRDLDDVRADTCVYPEVGSAQLITACMSDGVLITACRRSSNVQGALLWVE